MWVSNHILWRFWSFKGKNPKDQWPLFVIFHFNPCAQRSYYCYAFWKDYLCKNTFYWVLSSFQLWRLYSYSVTFKTTWFHFCPFVKQFLLKWSMGTGNGKKANLKEKTWAEIMLASWTFLTTFEYKDNNVVETYRE